MAILLAVVALTNIVYQVIHKPTELFAFVGHRLDKEPAETWRQYGALFRTYSTGTIPPELLAALAQGESSGSPVERTYWRRQWAEAFASLDCVLPIEGFSENNFNIVRRVFVDFMPKFYFAGRGCSW